MFGPELAPMSVGPNTMAKLLAVILLDAELSCTLFKCKVKARRVA